MKINTNKTKLMIFKYTQNHQFTTRIIMEEEQIDSFQKQSFTCQVCKASFTSNSRLTKHIECVHEGKKPFKCIICDYSAASKSYLNIHVEAVHEQKRPFKVQKL